MASNWIKMPGARYPIGVGYNGRRTRCPGWGAMTDFRRFARAPRFIHAARPGNCMSSRRGAPKQTKTDTLCSDYESSAFKTPSDPGDRGESEMVVVHRNQLWLIPILHRAAAPTSHNSWSVVRPSVFRAKPSTIIAKNSKEFRHPGRRLAQVRGGRAL